MDVNLNEMVVLITGAASGIGRAIAQEVAASGAEGLILTDRDAEGLDRVARDLSQQVEVKTLTADLANPAALMDLCSKAPTLFNRIDGLVNAAGVTTRGGFADGTGDAFDSIFTINVKAPFLLMQAVFADMEERDTGGAVVNIQSGVAHCGEIELSLYSASKGALQTLTKNAAHTYLPKGIRVNGINLGWTETETEHQLQSVTLGRGEDWASKAAQAMPLGRLLQPEEPARLATYLLSPASAPLTGTSIDLDQRVVGGP